MREDLTGRRYGRLTVCREIKQAEKSRRHYWLCRCDCGKEKTVEESHLKTGHTKSCGCYRKELPSSRRIDLTGRQFGRLKVLEEADNSNRTGEYWKCVCSCGRLIEASKESLCAGKTKSCGCLQAEMLSLIVSQVVLKTLYEIIVLPVTIRVVKKTKEHEAPTCMTTE